MSNPTLSLHSFILTVRRSPLWYKCLLAPAFRCCKNENNFHQRLLSTPSQKFFFWTISLPSRLKLDYSPPNSSAVNRSRAVGNTLHCHICVPAINPLHPKISIYILHTVLCTFTKVLTRRICLTIRRVS